MGKLLSLLLLGLTFMASAPAQAGIYAGIHAGIYIGRTPGGCNWWGGNCHSRSRCDRRNYSVLGDRYDRYGSNRRNYRLVDSDRSNRCGPHQRYCRGPNVMGFIGEIGGRIAGGVRGLVKRVGESVQRFGAGFKKGYETATTKWQARQGRWYLCGPDRCRPASGDCDGGGGCPCRKGTSECNKPQDNAEYVNGSRTEDNDGDTFAGVDDKKSKPKSDAVNDDETDDETDATKGREEGESLS